MGRTKPDLLNAGPEQSHILWYASFTSPLQPLNLSNASRKQYFNAKIHFDTKNNKHQPLIPYGYSFMPICGDLRRDLSAILQGSEVDVSHGGRRPELACSELGDPHTLVVLAPSP